MALLDVQELNTYYGQIHALQDVSINVEKGEIVTIIGANGAGKSTLLKTISGLLKPRRGSIQLEGEDLTRLKPHKIVKKGIVQVPEGRRIFGALTVTENLATGLRLSECHTGFRAYSRRFLETIPFLLNSDKFLFDTQVIFQAEAFGFRIAEVSVPARYFKEASSVGIRAGVPYGLGTLWTAAQYVAHKRGLATIDLFSKPLEEVVSRYHRLAIFGPESTGEGESGG